MNAPHDVPLTSSTTPAAPGPPAGNTGNTGNAGNGPIYWMPPPPPPRPRRRFLTWIGWCGFLVCVCLLIGQRSARQEYYNTDHGIHERFHSGSERGRDKVAILTVRGIILEGDGFVKQQIDRIREDASIKAVVVRIDSPGGTVTGSDYIYHHLRKLREERQLPLVVSMGSIATSGGYYVAMAVGDQEKAIFAEQTTTTGSIGVIVPHYDFSGLLARFDVRDDSISSHPRKQILSPTRVMSDEEREIIQAYVNESFEHFKAVIKTGRPHLRQENGGDLPRLEHQGRDLATGEIFTATQARQFGLIDEIGFIEDAVARARELAGLTQDNVRVICYQRPASLLDLIGIAQASGPEIPLGMLLESTAPRAYYLATTMPLLISSRSE